VIPLEKFFIDAKSGFYFVICDKEISQCTIVELNGEHKIPHSGNLISIVADEIKKNDKTNSKNSKPRFEEKPKINLLLLRNGKIIFEIKDIEGGIYKKASHVELLY
jgi:hypothetical protein